MKYWDGNHTINLLTLLAKLGIKRAQEEVEEYYELKVIYDLQMQVHPDEFGGSDY